MPRDMAYKLGPSRGSWQAASSFSTRTRKMDSQHLSEVASDQLQTIQVYISNMHCSSCVRTIEDALMLLSPAPQSVNVSIVTQLVTVKHDGSLSLDTVQDALDAAGFDLAPLHSEETQLSHHSLSHSPSLPSGKLQKHLAHCVLCQEEYASQKGHGEPSRSQLGPSSAGLTLVGDPMSDKAETASCANFSGPLGNIEEKHDSVLGQSPPAGPYKATLSVGGMTCASCSNTIHEQVSAIPGVSDTVINLLGASASMQVNDRNLLNTVVETIEDAGYEAEVVTVEPVVSSQTPSRSAAYPIADGPLRLNLSVGGMTCASCSNTITEVMSAIPGVTEAVVNLIGGSATAVVAAKDLCATLVEAIEDAGYEAEIISTDPVKDSNQVQGHEDLGPRSVALCIDGMFCSHCPGRVMAALSAYNGQLNVVKPVTDLANPIVQIEYTPDPPSLTLRTIVGIIASSSTGSDAFTVTVHHPPTVEARARQMQRREQRQLLQRLVFAVIVAIPTFIVGIVYMSLLPSSNATRVWFERPMWTGNVSRSQWAMFFLATPVMFYSAGTFHRRSLKEIWALWKPGSRTPIWRRFVRFGSMNLLVSTGVSVAYFASIALLALAATQAAAASGPGDVTTYFDSVVFLTMFLLAGRFLEAYSKGRTADAITALGKLRPASALVLEEASNDDGSERSLEGSSQEPKDLEKGDLTRDDPVLSAKPGMKVRRVDAEFLDIGDIVRVQHGASPPADGTIVYGDSGAFDESSLTGESRLVKKTIGEPVFVGTINKGGMVDVRVDAIGGETMLDRVVKVVREGQTHRAPIERVADLLTGYFVPVVTLLSVVTFVVWLGLGLGGALPQDYLDINVGGWTLWSLEFAIAVFVVACPCGIGLAAPTALLVGAGLAAKYGILARGGGEAFQEAAQLDVIVFDKTGTLTEGGEPRVTDAEVVEERWPREVLLGMAAEVESASSHPLALAIRQYCADNDSTQQSGSTFEETAGRGLKATFDALHCIAVIGNEEWMSEHGASVDGMQEKTLDVWKAEGKSVVLLALRDTTQDSPFHLSAMFAISDPLRPEAKGVIAHLNSQGIATWMISGDNSLTAKAVAKMVGIPETNVIAGVLPHQKAEKIQWLQQAGMKRRPTGLSRFIWKHQLNERCIVAMVGDGINDAPALASADVGIAIGSGSDVAISTASFILVSSNLQSLLTMTDLSRKIFNRVKFNFLWATIYNVVAVPIAAGVIYPAGHARLSPVWASLAMALSSVSVVCSSLMLKLYREPTIKAA